MKLIAQFSEAFPTFKPPYGHVSEGLFRAIAYRVLMDQWRRENALCYRIGGYGR